MKSRISTTPLGALIHLASAHPAKIDRQIVTRAVLLLIAIALLALVGVQLMQPASHARSAPAPLLIVRAYDATGAMRKSVVYPWEVRSTLPNTFYDATAAMQKAVVLPWEVQSPPTNTIYDATAAMQKAIVVPTFK